MPRNNRPHPLETVGGRPSAAAHVLDIHLSLLHIFCRTTCILPHCSKSVRRAPKPPCHPAVASLKINARRPPLCAPPRRPRTTPAKAASATNTSLHQIEDLNEEIGEGILIGFSRKESVSLSG